MASCLLSEGGLEVCHFPIGHPLRALLRDILRSSTGGMHPAGASPFPTPTPVLGASAIPPGPPRALSLPDGRPPWSGMTLPVLCAEFYPLALRASVACRPGGCCGLLVAVPRIGASGVPPWWMALRADTCASILGSANLGLRSELAVRRMYQTNNVVWLSLGEIYIYIYMLYVYYINILHI